jgi:hypothetical protein
VEARDPQPGRDGVCAQPAEAQLIAGGEQDDDGSGNRDVRKRESELNGRVRGLTCLGARWKVSASDEIKPAGCRTLTMRHVLMIADGPASAPAERVRRLRGSLEFVSHCLIRHELGQVSVQVSRRGSWLRVP